MVIVASQICVHLHEGGFGLATLKYLFIVRVTRCIRSTLVKTSIPDNPHVKLTFNIKNQLSANDAIAISRFRCASAQSHLLIPSMSRKGGWCHLDLPDARRCSPLSIQEMKGWPRLQECHQIKLLRYCHCSSVSIHFGLVLGASASASVRKHRRR